MHGQGRGLQAEGRRGHEPERRRRRPGYFGTLGMPLLARPRIHRQRTTQGAPRVAIINETMAKYFFGNENPLGRHFGLGRDKPPTSRSSASCSDAQDRATLREPSAALRLHPVPAGDREIGQLTFYVRAARRRGRGIGASRPAGRAARRSEPADLRHEDDDACRSTSRCSSSAWWRCCRWRSAGWRRCSRRSASTA